jgi:hypothetical protein
LTLDRYNSGDDRALQDAAAKLEIYLNIQLTTGTVSGTIVNFENKKGAAGKA